MNRRQLLQALASFSSVGGALVYSNPATAELSTIKADERVVLFDTDGQFDPARKIWRIPVHGWVHELDSATLRRITIKRLLATKYDIDVNEVNEANFDRRVRLLAADNESGKRLAARIGDREYPLTASAGNGHFRSTLELPQQLVERHAKGAALPIAVTAPGLKAPVQAFVCLIPSQGWSVISDIDDTVKISQVTDRAKLLDNSLLRDFKAVPKMADLYRHWAGQGASFHFVSSSPWHFYEPLQEFLRQAEFPPATLSLKMIRFKDSSIANLWRDGAETKPAQIEPILQAYPQRRFVLVGDSGEQDPEVYGAMARKYPQQIERVLIRNVTDTQPSQPRFQRAFADIDADRWQLFDNPGQVAGHR